MKVPISWLKDYVDIDVSPRVLAEKLTFSGIEVEGIATVGAAFEGLVVGEVTEVRPHPNADRLRLCTVNDGRGAVPVVCGANNVTAGVKAAFAPVGVTLPGGIKLKRARIRGEESLGMLCAEDELGLSDAHDGILLLPPDSVAGTPLADVLGGPETVLELEVTWNRPDCLCMIGIAREVAALLGKPLKLPAVVVAPGGGDVHERVRVSIDDPRSCNRYTARVLDDVRVGPSPAWMRRRLSLCGVRPISNVVDVTNYVMLECGHPLHAFDFNLLSDRTIRVRRAVAGETLETLDGVTRTLNAETLVIADARRPVALAGVMGGAGSEIAAGTRCVLLESAHFDPPQIRKTVSSLGLSTESSHRFERGVNAGSVAWASARAAALMQELAGATVLDGVVDSYPVPRVAIEIPLCYDRARRLLGVAIDAGEIRRILESLEMTCVDANEEGCTVRVPDFRLDLHIEADVIEEIARMHGLDRVPAPAPAARVVPGVSDAPSRAVFRVRDILAGLGLAETVTYSFVSPALLDLFDPADAPTRVALPNPVSADQGLLRHSLVPQLVETLGRNQAHQTTEMRAFEIGRVFTRRSDGGIAEETRVAIGLMGRSGPDGFLPVRAAVADEDMFLAVKGVVEALLEAAGVDAAAVEWMPCARPWLAAGRAALLRVAGRDLGCVGLLDAAVRHRWRMHGPVGVADLPLDWIAADVFSRRPPRAVPAYPSISRDVAMVVDAGIPHARIERVVRAAAPAELTRMELFDIFRSEGIGSGKQSLAYSLVYQSGERTLTDEEVNRFQDAVRAALKAELGAELREG